MGISSNGQEDLILIDEPQGIPGTGSGGGGSGDGSVTSVGLSSSGLSNIMSISATPVTDSGVIPLAATCALGDMIYGSATNVYSRLAANATATRKFARSVSGGIPAWDVLLAADIPSIDIVSQTSGTLPFNRVGSGAQPLDATLTALAAFVSTGFVVMSAADTFIARAIAGTTNLIVVTNGDGIAGPPTITIGSKVLTDDSSHTLTNKSIDAAQLTGSINIARLPVVSIAKGGTGQSTAPTQGQLLIGTLAGGLVPGDLVAGSNITLTKNVDGQITIAAASTLTTTTQSPGDNSTKLASTAYVDAAVAGVSGGGLSSSLASGKIYVGSGGGTATAVTPTGDVTISNTGVNTIKTNVALAGSPTTTTQAALDASTKIATTAYADAAVTAAEAVAANASNLTSGTVADARLSTNVPLKSGTNAFAGSNTFPTQTAADNSTKAATTAYVDGAVATGVAAAEAVAANASNLTSGSVADARLSANVPLKNAGNSWSVAQVPNAAGTIDLGSTVLPFRNFIYGASATNNSKLVSATTTAQRTVTTPDADSNTVIPTTATANQWLTNITAGGVQTKSQPAFTDLTGVATLAQLPTLDIAHGGTGQTTKAPAFDALQPMTTTGDTIFGGTSGTGTRLAIGNSYQLLGVVSGAPSWQYGLLGFQTLTAASPTLTSASPSYNAIDPTSNNVNPTLPQASTCLGKILWFKVLNATNTATITAFAGDSIEASSSISPVPLQIIGMISDGGTHWRYLKAMVESAVAGGTGSGVVPSSGQMLFGNAGGTAYAPATVSGDVTAASTGAITIKSSVALAGSPTTTTQTLGDNSTKIATTAFVIANAGGGGGSGTINSGTTDGVAYYSGATTVSSTAAGNVGQTLQGQGAGVAPIFADQSVFPSISSSVTRSVGQVYIGTFTATSHTGIGFDSTPTASGTGSNAFGTDGNWVNYATSATINSVGGINGANTNGPRWAALPRMGCTIKTGSLSTDIQSCGICVGWVQSLTAQTSVSVSSSNLAYFRYFPATDGTLFWRCVTSNGTTLNVATTTMAIASNTKYTMFVDCSNPSAFTFWINGVLVATMSANLPGADTNPLYWNATVSNQAAAAVNFKVKNVWVDSL